jgi:HEAT repeat protein
MSPLRLLAVLLVLATSASGGPAEVAHQKALEELLSEKAAVRARGCRRLADLGGRKAIASLLRSLEDENAGVRAAAVDALNMLGDEVAVPGIARLVEDPSPHVRGRVLIALGSLAGKYIGPKVAARLQDTDPGVRISAVNALGAIGDPLWSDAVIKLLDRTKEDPDHLLLSTAIIALTRMSGKKALADLHVRVGEAEAFDSWLVRASLLWAIGEVADRERLPFVKRCFGTDDHRVYGAAATALMKLGEFETVLATLKSEDARRRRVAVAALAESGDLRWRDTLLEFARDGSSAVRLEVAVGLSRMGAEESFPLLLRGLASSSVLLWGGCARRLKRAYGQDFGRNPEKWVAWYKEHKGRLVWDAAKKTWRIRAAAR